MLIEFDNEKLKSAMLDYYYTTGMNISVFYEDYSLFGYAKNNNEYCGLIQSSAGGLKECLDTSKSLMERSRSSGRTEYTVCHAGLVEIVIPIIYEGNTVGYMMLGHVREAWGDFDIEEALAGMPVDIEVARNIYISLPSFDKERMSATVRIAEMLVKFMLYENMFRIKKSYFDEAKRYIYDNLGEKLTAKRIYDAIHVSKSTLYAAIKDATGQSVNDYITGIKLDRSKELLSESEISINDISNMLGFSNVTYFTKFFKKHVGIAPTAFRKKFSKK